MTPLPYNYLHRELRLVREFDLRMAREARRKLEELPGWWEDERIIGTPLLARVSDHHDPARKVLDVLHPDPWLESRRRKKSGFARCINYCRAGRPGPRPQTRPF